MFKDIEISKANSYIRMIDEDTSFPRYSDSPVTKIRDITSDRNYHVLIVNVIKSPERLESVDPETMEEVPGMDYARAIVEDDTGQIPLVALNPFILDELKSGDRIKVIGQSLFHTMLNRYYFMLPTNINSFEKL
jgi:hypothetical protein